MKDVLTTGDIAKLCSVAPRTVTQWIDTGMLKGYFLPGTKSRKDRRVTRSALWEFLREHHLPVGSSVSDGSQRVLAITTDVRLMSALASCHNVRATAYTFEAGALFRVFEPQMLVVDLELVSVNDAVAIVGYLASELLPPTMVAALTDDASSAPPGYEVSLRRPYTNQSVKECLQWKPTNGSKPRSRNGRAATRRSK